MRAIAAHFRYISKNGRLEIDDDRGENIKGAHAVRDLANDWRFSGSLIPEDIGGGGRREAFNIMLSMRRGTDPLAVQRAAREFARAELAGHKYVMVLHDHQANPHVHISVRAESRMGKRLNPRKADLHRWRETFAEKLRELGIDAEASPQATRGRTWTPRALWQMKAERDGRLRADPMKVRANSENSMTNEAWAAITRALVLSDAPSDVSLGRAVATFSQTVTVRPETGTKRRLGPDLKNGGRTILDQEGHLAPVRDADSSR
jgi:hypothetical protein